MIRESLRECKKTWLVIYLTTESQNIIHEARNWENCKKKEKSTITLGDYNCPLSIIDRTSKQKISKNIKYLNNYINQLYQAVK